MRQPSVSWHILMALMAAIVMLTSGCVWKITSVEIDTLNPATVTQVTSPVKAHLRDGSTVIYPTGVTVTGNTLVGFGRHYTVALVESPIQRVPLDMVIGMESYRDRTRVGESVLLSAATNVGIAFGSAALAVAIFGSCPTVYSDSGTVMEAELFSYSIAPLFEGRDLDRLHARASANNVVQLVVRNEALETHYLNHLQLLEIQSGKDEIVLPDQDNQPVIVSDLQPPVVAQNRAGLDVRATLQQADDEAYRTSTGGIDRASIDDMDDWLDLTVPVSRDSGAVALTLTLRNSLLSTSLLYDTMLGSAGARALDWLSEDLAEIATAVELGRWYQRRAGLHVSVWRDGAFREVVRVPDSGPIAWRDVAAVVPVLPGEESLRIRLSFLADHWRIDRLRVASQVRNAEARIIPLAQITSAVGQEADALGSLSAPDAHYLKTNPGQEFTAVFDVGPMPTGRSRTFLLSSQGYYTEWIRGTWIQSAKTTEPFIPTDAALLSTLRAWRDTREAFEDEFFRARVDTR